jgi:DNA-binding MarR family transcriptional regulator
MGMKSDDLVKQLGALAFATRLKRLAEQLQQDVARLYNELEVDFEPKWFAMLYALYNNGVMSVNELAAMLRVTHPAIVQFTGQMQKAKLVQTVKDKNDARRKLVKLTEKGKSTYEKITPVLKKIEKATKGLIDETGVDMLNVLGLMEEKLEEKNMYERVTDLSDKKKTIGKLK